MPTRRRHCVLLSRPCCLVAALVALIVPAHLVAAQALEAPSTDVNTLAREQQNPISSVVSMPFQMNFDSGGGLEDRNSFILNFQPVTPFKLNDQWNLIFRTVLPIATVPAPEDTRYSGIGDIQEQLFLTPSRRSKILWGIGPQFSLPTATLTPFETGSWAAGPSFVTLTMRGHWTLGALMYNVWTFADSGDATKTDLFFLQPIVHYNFGPGWALSTIPVITANWDAESGQQWTVPVGLGIGRTTVFSGRPMTLALQYYHNVVHPDAAGANTVRFLVVFLYPKK